MTREEFRKVLISLVEEYLHSLESDEEDLSLDDFLAFLEMK